VSGSTSIYYLRGEFDIFGLSRLKFFSRLKPDGLARRNVGDFSRSRIASNAALPGLDDEHAEAAQFYALAALQRLFHRLEQRLNCYFGFDLWNASLIGNLIDYV
jgi:hypothetical protein